MTYNGVPGISTVVAELQRKADHDGTPVATMYESELLIAIPGGSKQKLVDEYYKAVAAVQASASSYMYGISASTPKYVKFPPLLSWLRSLVMPGEITT